MFLLPLHTHSAEWLTWLGHWDHTRIIILRGESRASRFIHHKFINSDYGVCTSDYGLPEDTHTTHTQHILHIPVVLVDTNRVVSRTGPRTNTKRTWNQSSFARTITYCLVFTLLLWVMRGLQSVGTQLQQQQQQLFFV